MTQNDASLFAGERVGSVYRNKDGAGQVLMQVRPANAAPLNLHLHPAGGRGGRKRHRFNPHIFFAVPYCGLHALRHNDLSRKRVYDALSFAQVVP